MSEVPDDLLKVKYIIPDWEHLTQRYKDDPNPSGRFMSTIMYKPRKSKPLDRKADKPTIKP